MGSGWRAPQGREVRQYARRVGCRLLRLPGELFSVVRGVTQTLERQGFDLILSNQSHQAWGEAFKATGYLPGPSNFLFAASKKLAKLLAPFEEVRPRMHSTRSDGDGLPGNF
jgi:hypothetical protein